MTTETESIHNNIQTVPTSISVVMEDNDQSVYYPSAAMVLIDEDDEDDRKPPAIQEPTDTESDGDNDNNNNNYAIAEVVGNEISPFAYQSVAATSTIATAVALNPWPNTTTEARSNGNSSEGRGTRAASRIEVTVVQHRGTFLEDPFHKKIRRRNRRRQRMLAIGSSSFLIGAMFGGPIGAIAGAVSGVAIARTASKSGERRKDKRVRRQMRQMQNQHPNR